MVLQAEGRRREHWHASNRVFNRRMWFRAVSPGPRRNFSGISRTASPSPSVMLCRALFLVLLGQATACVSPDCDRPDFGTCGVACCSLVLSFPNTSTVDLMTKLNSSLATGGPDNRFVLRPTAESAYGFGDLRPYHPEAVNFIGQAWHKTAKYTYTDTINYLIYAPPKDAPGASSMKVFSISQIGGAYGDAGQKYAPLGSNQRFSDCALSANRTVLDPHVQLQEHRGPDQGSQHPVERRVGRGLPQGGPERLSLPRRARRQGALCLHSVGALRSLVMRACDASAFRSRTHARELLALRNACAQRKPRCSIPFQRDAVTLSSARRPSAQSREREQRE